MLRDYSDDEIDADLRHLGILFYWTTRRFGKNKLILDHYNTVREFAHKVYSEQQDIRAISRGVSDEQINSLAKISAVPLYEISCIADWPVPMLKEELNKRGAQIPSNASKPNFLSMMIQSLISDRQTTGRIVQFRSSGAMSVDPRSSGAMSVDPPMCYLGIWIRLHDKQGNIISYTYIQVKSAFEY